VLHWLIVFGSAGTARVDYVRNEETHISIIIDNAGAGEMPWGVVL
jgi:hypothetical protein